MFSRLSSCTSHAEANNFIDVTQSVVDIVMGIAISTYPDNILVALMCPQWSDLS